MNNEKLLQMGEGNPGALNSLMALSESGFTDAIERLDKLNIRGSDIYVISSDLAGTDASVANHLIMNTDDGKLKDAASRQDYSGRELLKDEIEAAKQSAKAAE